ncbi:MAG TPA: MASE1 domain-containing protein [Gemmatimonadales bacterium]|nr:MASE1 domain-containing protein [Gemmatimonadales bacterium]
MSGQSPHRAKPRLPAAAVYLARVALLALVYCAAARLGLQYASIAHSVSLVWPPTGIAFAALALLGYRYWPGVATGAFLANLLTPVPVAAAAGIALGNTGEAILAAYLLRRVAGPRPQIEDLRHVRALIFVAAPLAGLVSAGIGVTSLWATGALTERIPMALAIWWAGDVLGALVIAPVLFAWATPPRRTVSARPILEAVALCLGTALAAELAVGPLYGVAVLRGIEYTYLLFAFVVWAALRFGARGASLLTLTVAALAVWHAVRDGTAAGGTLFAITCYLAVVAVTGLILSAAIVWEREQATTALRRREDQLRLALGAARMGSWFWSIEGNRLTWDDDLKRLYGLAPDDRVPSYDAFLQLVHPDDRSFVAESVRKALEEDGALDYEFRTVLPDGRVRWIADQGEVGRDAAGRPIYMTGVCMDVTERRLAEERLQQAHRMESVGRLAGGVAHETSNQMTVVLGATSFMLRAPGLPAKLRADLEHIRKAAERTAAVSAQLLAFSRRQMLSPEVLDLNGLIRSWEPVLRRVMGEDCELLLELSPELGRIKADAGRLEQALLNLALNARDAMPHGGRLSIQTFPAELTPAYAKSKPGVAIRPAPYAVLAVSDTGHGMDRRTLDRIFEPFFTTKPVGQGSGLGLSVVYGIVKQSDGFVWAYSEPGGGATFKVYLPLTADACLLPFPPPASPGRSSASECVLVVEDESSVRQVARRTLEDAGYAVVEAHSGPDALELLTRATKPIRLVLTDVVMPGMSGRELGARVAALAPGTPVLFMSGYTNGEIVRRGLLDAETAFLQKPFTPEALVTVVRQALDIGPDRPAGAAATPG